MQISTETEQRTLQEIEDHFNGLKKLPRTMKSRRKSLPTLTYTNHVELEETKPNSDSEDLETTTPSVKIEIPRVKLDISHWDSNNKFENYLKDHHLDPMKQNPIKNHIEHRLKPEKRHHQHHVDKNGNSVNKVDLDTPL